MTPGLVHWDDVEPRDLRRGPMQLDRIDLGHAAGTKRVGVARLRIDPGGRSSPVHVELDEEEVFYVLAGSGLSWQDGKTYEVRAGRHDRPPRRRGGSHADRRADGLDVLAFGERTNATASYLTRAGVLRMDATVKVAEERHPWDLEADAGDLELPEPSPRPSNIVHRDAVESEFDGMYWDLATPAGSERTGLNYIALRPGAEGAPPHCHSARRGDLHRARRRGRARALADAGRAAPAPGRGEGGAPTTRGSCRLAPCGDPDRALLPGRGRDVHLPRLRHPQTPTTSPTTRARTRSTSGASASSHAWRISTTSTASRPRPVGEVPLTRAARGRR